MVLFLGALHPALGAAFHDDAFLRRTFVCEWVPLLMQSLMKSSSGKSVSTSQNIGCSLR